MSKSNESWVSGNLTKFVILIVDDNANNLFILQKQLDKVRGCHIIKALGGEEAIRITLEKSIDLILMDIQMPGLDGFETADRIKNTKKTKEIPIIFITGVFKEDEFIRRGYAQGIVDYLIKPVDKNLLTNRVQHYKFLDQKEKDLEQTLRALNQANQVIQKERNLLEKRVLERTQELSQMNQELSQEIIERKKIEERCKQSEERYRVLIELSPEGIIVHNDKKILYSNPKALEIFGAANLEDLKGIPIIDFAHSDYQEEIQKKQTYGMNACQSPDIRDKLITLDQRTIDVEIKGELITYQNQKATLLLLSDITNQKRSEEIQKTNEQLKLSNEHLESINKSKDELISLVSHELRTPIASIMGYAETIIECELEAEQENRFLCTIVEESERLSRLIGNFLDATKYSIQIFDFNFKEEHIEELLEQTLNSLQGLADEKKLSIKKQIPNLNFMGDGEKIIQVLLNLLGNAIKFSPIGGIINIKVNKKSKKMHIFIEDEGGGIAVNELTTIFDKFHQMDQNYGSGGAGLGLYISKKIIEGHNGNLVAENTDKGALFHVNLPVIQK